MKDPIFTSYFLEMLIRYPRLRTSFDATPDWELSSVFYTDCRDAEAGLNSAVEKSSPSMDEVCESTANDHRPKLSLNLSSQVNYHLYHTF